MKKNKTMRVLIGLLVLFGIVVVFTFSNLFSLIDMGANHPSCEIGMEGGYCDLYLDLPAGQMVSEGYSFDIITRPVAEEEFKDKQPLIMTGEAGPFTEDRVGASWTIWHNLYLYEVPRSWVDIYELKLEYEMDSQTRISAVSGPSGSAYAEMFLGYVNIPYPHPSPIVCPRDDRTWCNDNINDWVIRSEFDEYNRYRQNSLIYTNTKETSLISVRNGGSESLLMTDESVIRGSNLPSENIKVLIKTEFEIDGEYRDNDVTLTNFDAPTLYTSYKQNQYLTNLEVVVGGERVYYRSGKVDEGLLFLPDISHAINSFCGRLDSEQRDEECLVRMRFNSDNAGVIHIVGNLGVLTQTVPPADSDSENTFNQPSIFDNLIGLISIIGFLVVVVAIVLYLVFRGGRF